MTRLAFRVGFDRFIDINWANYAFELAKSNLVQDEKSRDLKIWLMGQIAGRESAEKTALVLKNLWFGDYSNVSILKQRAFEIGNGEIQPSSKVILSYGMALNVFPFFRDVCTIAGRLFNLQGSFHRKELHKRVLEKYGNLGSIPRAADRILQSLVSWGMLLSQNKEYVVLSNDINSPVINSWVSEAVLFASPQRRLAVTDLIHSPELLGIRLIRNNFDKSDILRFERDGANAEFVYV